MLVREKGFVAVARPRGHSDEAIIAVRADSPVRCVEDLTPGSRVVSTGNPDVDMMGMILLEAADLNAGNTLRVTADTFVLVARKLLKGDADAGIFLAEAFDGLTALTRKDLRVIVRSEISVVQHMLMIGPKFRHRQADLTAVLVAAQDDPKTQSVTEGLGFAGWDTVAQEDVEFMIDLIDTLAFQPDS